MRVLLAPQELKGTLTAPEAADAIAQGLAEALPGVELDRCPVADGGPGLLEALASLERAVVHTVDVEDALGRTVRARFLTLPGDEAVVEMAAASGLTALGPSRRDAGRASTFGTGQLIRAALDTGARRIWIGAGGSATTDGGAGALEALGARLLGRDGAGVPRGGAALGALERIELDGLDPRLRHTGLSVLVDVQSPLLGPCGASLMFAAQKGADEATRAKLEDALAHFSSLLTEAANVPLSARDRPGVGAAGGLVFGLHVGLGAAIVPGFETVAARLDLRARIARSDWVITAEGRVDAQSALGKGPWRIGVWAAELGKSCACFTGRLEVTAAPFTRVIELPGPLPRTTREAFAQLRGATVHWAQHALTNRTPLA